MNRFLVAILIIIGLLTACVGGSSRPVRESSSPRTVISDSGNSDKVSRDFTVSGGCRNGRLEYSGSQIDPDVESSWVNFRIYDVEISEYSVESSGTHDLIPTGSGSSRVSLDSGTYYVEVENWNSEWEYTITCR